MQVTKAGEYGVLGLMNLARRRPGEVVMIDDVSRDEHISKSFLGKIFQSLVKADIIRSNRGAGGGFMLVKRPEEITVLDIIEAVEGRITLQRCLIETSACQAFAHCALGAVFAEAQARVREVFAQTTLGDLLRHRPGPAAALGSQPFSCRPVRALKNPRSIRL